MESRLGTVGGTRRNGGCWTPHIIVNVIIRRNTGILRTVEGSPSDVQLNWSNLTELSEISVHQQFDVNCSSSGYPVPAVTWTKEGTVTPISAGSGFSSLSFSYMDRSISGRYVCQSDNGIPPMRRKEAIIHVFYPPSIRELTVFTVDHTQIGIEEYLMCVVEAHPAATVTWAAIGYHSIGSPNTTDVSPSPFYSVVESRLPLAGIATGNSPKEFTCIARNKFGVAERTVQLTEDKQDKRWISGIVIGAGTIAGVLLCVTAVIIVVRRGFFAFTREPSSHVRASERIGSWRGF
ncbi:lachesin-like [Diadema setosum]|uniref:lachesin-like n=1 Tax=Diadema setosum TaxID=31175 RepID=UPI003B3B76F2